MDSTTPPEHNVTGIDYSDRLHFHYQGPLIDIHTHLMLTRLGAEPHNPRGDLGQEGSITQAETMDSVAAEFGVVHICTMCPPEDIPPLRARFGARLSYNGSISRKPDEPDDVALRLVDRFVELGAKLIKFWAAPRGRDRGLLLDTPWRRAALQRAREAGMRVVMVHVGDPDRWFQTVYADTARYGTKASQYEPLERLLEQNPDLSWISAHMGGDPEHPDHLEALLERYPHLYLDTSATKWQVREVSPRRDALRSLICRYPERFLFGSDLVTRHDLPREHYVSRYWCQRTLWESTWEGRSPIADPDFLPSPGEPSTPLLCGLNLPPDVLRKVYYENARRLLQLAPTGSAPGAS